MGMILGEKGRIIRETRLRATQILVQNIQRPVSMTITVVKRRNSIAAQNKFDEVDEIVE